jgi:hypothetical protein
VWAERRIAEYTHTHTHRYASHNDVFVKDGPHTLTEVFPCFSLSCKANARVKLAKMGHGQHSSKFVVCVVLFVIRIVLLLIVMFYVLFVCKCVLPPGVNSTAIHKYIIIGQYSRLDLFKE